MTALRLARERGADIVLLDDLGERAVPIVRIDRAAQWCADRLAETDAKSITIRIAILDDAPTVTFSRDGEAVDRLLLDA